MIAIQDLGVSILSDSPKSFYILGGSEHGIKDTYISHLEEHYGQKYEYEHVKDVLDMMKVRHIIPLAPALYVIRYDESFVSSVSDMTKLDIHNSNIIGTIVCIYNDEKQIKKLDKYLPNYVAVIDSVNPKFISKYLHRDFPKLDDRSIKIATQIGKNYGHSRNICKSMMCADLAVLATYSESKLSYLFGCSDPSDESQFQKAIAAKNFKCLVALTDNYTDSLDNLVYTILQTMIELEKILSYKYSNSELRDYIKLWTKEDIYYMFMHAYSQLAILRSNTSSDARSSLIYLYGLLTFQHIPSVEAMNEF